ncbi:hypothetical protein A2U01_0062464, partial [Trifolium medium]|nr:hypothetical protein [Trifolium medium]
MGVRQSSISSVVMTSFVVSALAEDMISCITVLLLPGLFVLASFDSKSALEFCSLGT